MSTSGKEVLHKGWLWKSPPAKVTIFRPKRWSRRFFVLKNGTYPCQYVLEYFHDESARRSKRTINLDECEQICGPLNVQDRHHKYAFHLRTQTRTYYLAANSEPDMNKWIEALCQVCGLKITEDDRATEGTLYEKPNYDSSSQPTGDSLVINHESDGSSPTPSNKSPSGPYIPISECYTGLPVHFNPNTNEEITYYNTSSFPFPPPLAYPHRRDGSDDSSFHKSNDAPPRPPKKNSSKPTTPTTVATQSKPSCSPKSIDESHQSVGHSAGVYENLEDNPETSSTSSPLHSPAGGLYCNIPDASDGKSAGAANLSLKASPSPSPSSTSGTSLSAIPPKVDRNLKPEVRKANELNSGTKSNPLASHSNLRTCNTLPNKSTGCIYPGPEIDRSRKPSDCPVPLTLSSTPAQLKAMKNDARSGSHVRVTNISTLPNRGRRNGPVHCLNERFPYSSHDDSSPGLCGAYMEIPFEKSTTDLEIRAHTLKPANKTNLLSAKEGTVEYRVIDHVKTKALNQMRQDRERQFKMSKAVNQH